MKIGIHHSLKVHTPKKKVVSLLPLVLALIPSRWILSAHIAPLQDGLGISIPGVFNKAILNRAPGPGFSNDLHQGRLSLARPSTTCSCSWSRVSCSGTTWRSSTAPSAAPRGSRWRRGRCRDWSDPRGLVGAGRSAGPGEAAKLRGSEEPGQGNWLICRYL